MSDEPETPDALSAAILLLRDAEQEIANLHYEINHLRPKARAFDILERLTGLITDRDTVNPMRGGIGDIDFRINMFCEEQERKAKELHAKAMDMAYEAAADVRATYRPGTFRANERAPGEWVSGDTEVETHTLVADGTLRYAVRKDAGAKKNDGTPPGERP